MTGVVLGWLWCSPVAQAQAPEEVARRHFEQGYAAAQQGAFDQAIEEFKQAYAASPNFFVLFNLGQAHGAAGQPVEAASTLTRYLVIGGAAIDAEQRRATQDLIARYQRRIGRIRIGTLPFGSSVTLDGEELGSAALREPFEAASGRHGLAVRAPGYEPFIASVDVRGGESTSVEPTLRPLGKEGTVVPRCSVPCARAEGLELSRAQRARTQKIVALSLGGAAVVTGGAALALAMVNASRHNAWQRNSEEFTATFQRDPSSVRPQQLEDLLQEEAAIRNRDAAALGLGVASGLLAIGSVALYLTAGSGTPSVTVGPRGAWHFHYRASF